jgi:hypothetical protein
MKIKTSARLQKFKDTIAWKGMNSLEFKGFYIFLKLIAWSFFIVYLFTAGFGAWNWASIKILRLRPIDDAAGIFANAQQDPYAVEYWMAFRPLTDTPYILDHADEVAPYLGHAAFFELSRRALYMDRPDDAKFWKMMARYRLRYDLVRCAFSEASEGGEILERINGHMPQWQPDDLTPAESVTLMRRVLDYDEKHPPQNDPARVCRQVRSLTRSESHDITRPRAEWENMRFSLRYATEDSIKEEEAAQKLH